MSTNREPAQVTQVNIRLGDGGAASVARALADGLRARGLRSPFVYGYGPRGARAELHDAYDAVKLTPPPIAWLNREAHSRLGQETRWHDPQAWRRMRETFEASDVVHLHAIHSYFANPYALLDLLGDVGTPVVWTLHDSWIMTGRCALPGDCRGFETGCVRCPTLGAYPPARTDHASEFWHVRRASIRRLTERVPVVFAAIAPWVADEARAAGFDDVRLVANSIDEAFWSALSERPRRETGDSRTLFVNRDLRDPAKVDWPLLTRLATVPGQRLTIVGDHAPTAIPGVEHHPAVSDRARLAGIMQNHDRLLFTSQVDHFSLTIAEALAAGMDVVARDSRAARGFDGYENVAIVGTDDDLLAALAEPLGAPAPRADEFHPARMVDDYVEIYRELHARANGSR